MKQFLILLCFLMIGCNSPLNKSENTPLGGPPAPPPSSVNAGFLVSISSSEGGLVTPGFGDKNYPTPVLTIQVLAIQAYAYPGYVFSHWTGKVADEFNPSTIVLVNENIDIVAHFVKTYNG